MGSAWWAKSAEHVTKIQMQQIGNNRLSHVNIEWQLQKMAS
jgi:hypothetical protein